MTALQCDRRGAEIPQTVNHVACFVIVDTGGSAPFLYTRGLQRAARSFSRRLRREGWGDERVRIGLIEAGRRCVVWSNPDRIENFSVPPLRFGGVADCSRAYREALNRLENQLLAWTSEGIPFVQPLIFYIRRNSADAADRDIVEIESQREGMRFTTPRLQIAQVDDMEGIGNRAEGEHWLLEARRVFDQLAESLKGLVAMTGEGER